VLSAGERLQPLLSPIRLQLLTTLREPDSAAGLARRLGLKRQRVNYHLRALEREGFVELAETRKRRGSVERRMRATARAYLVSPALLGALAATPENVGDRFSSLYLVALGSQLIGDVAELRSRAEAANQKLATLALEVDVRFRSAADRAAFAQELADTLARLAARYHDAAAPAGRTHRFVVAGHARLDPTATKPKPKEKS
jgi:DNA-binding transcriptional ArsR family regulator